MLTSRVLRAGFQAISNDYRGVQVISNDYRGGGGSQLFAASEKMTRTTMCHSNKAISGIGLRRGLQSEQSTLPKYNVTVAPKNYSRLHQKIY